MEMDFPPTGKVRSPRLKRSAPATIYPEILVIVDYDGYRCALRKYLSNIDMCRDVRIFLGRLHNGDNTEIKKYFVSFWNGVDLRYKLLKAPKVRISIAGIIISRVKWTLSSLIAQSNIMHDGAVFLLFLGPRCDAIL